MHHPVFFAIARALLASVFIGLGVERILVGGASIGALAFSGFELLLGLMLAAGWRARWVALVLTAFLLVDAALSHPFWRFAAGAERHGQLLHFLKNLSQIGGLLLLSWVEAGRAAAAGSGRTAIK